MLNSENYVPIIKWKRGEYNALSKLERTMKDRITPLIQLVPPGYDHETGSVSGTIERRLDTFLQTHKRVWGDRRCFLDFNLLESPYTVKGTQQQPIEYVFYRLDLFHKAIPVVSLDRHQIYINAVKQIVGSQKKGCCIRLSLEQGYNENLVFDLQNLLSFLSVAVTEADIVIDLGAPETFDPIPAFAKALSPLFLKVAAVGTWRSVAVCGSSFPESMGDIKAPFGIIIRKEWALYKELKKSDLGGIEKNLIFGDYDIVHPKQPDGLDFSMINPAASLKYTIDDAWAIHKGKGLKKKSKRKQQEHTPQKSLDEGRPQFIKLCKALVKSGHFLGAEYSAGDQKISDTAKTLESDPNSWKPGNQNTWMETGINHHFTKVLDDLSSLHGF